MATPSVDASVASSTISSTASISANASSILSSSISSTLSSSPVPTSTIVSPTTTTTHHGLLPTFDLGSGGSDLIVGSAQNQSALGTQLTICIVGGLALFLAFCFLRTRLPVIFAPRTNMKRHKPPVLPDSFFGWIIPLIKISKDEMLHNVGLDAVLMLQFIEMCIKIFGLCSIMGIIILIPISMTSDDSNLENEKSLDRLSITVIQNGSNRLIAYLVLMYTFTLIVFYFLKQSYNTYIYLRAQYLLRLSKTMASRSVIITGIPEELRNDQSLAEYYERLEIGSVESCYVVRTIHGLHKLIKRRADALLKLERAYATFWRNPCTIPGYDPDRILDDVKMYRRVLEAADKRAEEAGTSSSSEEEEDLREKFRKNNKKKKTFLNTTFFKGLVEPNAMMGAKESHRPQVRTGLWGLFGQKVDAIEYYTKLFDDLDKTVVERRTSPLYEMTSVAFITFEHMSSATIASQIAINPQPFACRTTMANEPRDVLWHSVAIRGRERIIREVIIWAITIGLVLLWFVPVVFLSSLMSIDMIHKISPTVAEQIEGNTLLNNIISTFIPTILINIVTSILPMIFDALGYFQGLRSRSAIAESTLSKYFFFLVFFNLVVFTLAGTSIRAIMLDVAQDPSSIATRLAKSLTTISPFFINYTILQGILLMPLNLLLLGALIIRGFYNTLCKTPRDYAENRAPWTFNYGINYSLPLLIFIIVLEYSVISPLILLFGTVYFCMTYIVFKYQFLYVYFRPYEVAGKLWRMVVPRVVFGLLLFQLTMCGLFALKSFYLLSILTIPLMVLTCLFKYILGLAFEENGRHLPMQLLREKREDPGDISDGEDDTSSDEEENCNAKKQEQKAELRSKWKKAALSAIQLKPETNNESEDLVRPRHSRLVLDEDDYEATPDHRTDYRQPPMQLNPGLLDTGLKKYGNPLLVGILPQLWLPVKKLDDEAPVAQPSHHHNLHHLPNGGKVAQQLAEILRKMESDKGTQRRQSTEEARKAAAQKTAHHIATSFAQKNTSSRGLWLKALHHPSSDTMSTMEEGGEHTGVLLGEKPSTEALLPKNIHGTYYHHPDRRSSAILSRRRPVLQEQSGNHSAPADILFTVHHDEGKDLGENDIREKDGEKKD